MASMDATIEEMTGRHQRAEQMLRPSPETLAAIKDRHNAKRARGRRV
jgi:hypothetical protein